MSRRACLTWTVVAVVSMSSCDLLGLGGGDAGTGGGTAGAGGGSAGTGGGSACTPRVCGAPGALCGQVDDGCGRPLDCGTCACTPSTFATDCPSRPCQVATGCTSATCVYEPVTCNFQPCTACVPGADGGCDDASARGCGPGCAADFCDPRPTTSNGVTTYANTCIARTDVHCGTCGLGGMFCAQGDAGVASCQGVTLAGVNPSLVECNGGSPSATILFVDPAATTATHTGAREAPFLTLDEAVAAAGARGSRAIIIGGSPTFPRALVVSSGLSIVGGYTGYPAWLRDPSRRPVFAVPAAGLASGRLVGLQAASITSPTEVVSVDVVTPDLTGVATAAGGASNFGAWLQGASQLALVDVHFRVGAAQAGSAGVNGPAISSSVPASSGGSTGKSVSFDVALQSFACTGASWSTIAGGAGQAPTCGGAAVPASAGGSGGTVPKATAPATTPFFTAGSTSPGGAAGGLIAVSGSTYVAGSGNGKDGAAWPTAAQAGAGGTPSVTWVSGAPVPQGRGGTGTAGKHGIGGGGGSGGGSLGTNGDPTWCYTGGGGGAGGAGGCGGTAGTGGYPGGWSVGLVVSGSPGLVLQGVTVAAGTGGSGGPGGSGGTPTAGANGGSGGPRQPDSAGAGTDVLFAGYPGGKGSGGQVGGAGGSGATGQTRGALCDGPVQLTGLAASSTSPTFQAAEGCN